MNMPHPTKVASNGKPTLTIPIVIFSDETSGNKTKKWNQLETYSMFLASLPRNQITQFRNINCICASNLVDSVSIGKVVVQDLKGTLVYNHSKYTNIQILGVNNKINCITCG